MFAPQYDRSQGQNDYIVITESKIRVDKMDAGILRNYDDNITLIIKI